MLQMTEYRRARTHIDTTGGRISFRSWIAVEKKRLEDLGVNSEVRTKSAGMALWVDDPGNLVDSKEASLNASN